MKKIRLTLPERTLEYDIVVGNGLLQEAGELLSVKDYSKLFVVTDEHVGPLWFDKLRSALPRLDGSISVPAGEQAKHIENVQRIWTAMREAGCDRKSLVIVLGGGVLGDMAGFAASTYMRGVAFAQIPTTLVAQVDSSIGGKTGFDFDGIKNLLGTFAQPTGVLIDTDTLSTLPVRELVAGFAEMFKHGLIHDVNYFEHLSQKPPQEYTASQLADLIDRSVRIKAEIVSGDERESGNRKLLNFGHTVGHAVEALSWETDHPLLHGEAVAIGMVVEADISQSKGYITHEEVQRIQRVLAAAGLPTGLPRSTVDDLCAKMALDKKSERGILLFTLLKHLGEAVYDQTVDRNVLERILATSMEHAHAD